MAGRPLNPKQQRFVHEYLIDLNATQAAVRAGYSKKTAHSQGPRLLENVGVAAAIRKAQEERNERTGINADWILNRLAVESEADVADLIDENGHVKSVHDWPLIWRQGLVAGMDVSVEWETVDGEKKPQATVTKLRLSDRGKRLEMLGRHVKVGAFADRVKHEGSLTVEVQDLTGE